MSGQIYHVIGPPGTGKTTALSRQAALAVAARGPESVVALSLTRTAAAEIAGRHTGIPAEQVGTLHSILYRDGWAGRLILDSPKGLKVWNEWIEAQGQPQWKLNGKGVDPDDPHGDRSPSATLGDELLEIFNLHRHRMSPPGSLPESVRAFGQAWLRGLEELDAVDFTLMIERGLTLEACPGNPSAILCDEAQDFSRLETAVVHRWAGSTETTVLVGDPDQNLYEWRGANPRIFLDHPVPESHQRVLGQSYRVPTAVHGLAQAVIGRVQGRAPIAYAPTTTAGKVTRCDGAQWAKPEGWLNEVLEALQHTQHGTTDPSHGVLVIAPCSYQLEPLLAVLRREGIPFANRFRTKRGDWNPLAGAGTDRATAANQLAAYLSSDDEGWTVPKLQLWIPLLRSSIRKTDGGVLARGAKTTVERCTKDRLSAEEWQALWRSPFQEQAVNEHGRARSIEWLLESTTPKDRDRLRYPINVYRRGGIAALQSEPLLTVGTIHAAKGGEADHVLVTSALPPRWASSSGDYWSDELHRLFYVGVTRARQSLTILAGDVGRYPL